MPRSPIIKLSKKPLRFPKKFVRRAVGTIKNRRVPVLRGHPTYSSRNHKGKGAYSGAARPPVKNPVMVGQRTGDAQTTFKPKPSRIGIRAVPENVVHGINCRTERAFRSKRDTDSLDLMRKGEGVI
ncbi:hypothetical protein HPP92_027822 [Vanilla planifolia]|uniref:Uncharacterized protein n=1 Tax=Vanilla planifolia TaxID=51239 RepID=A0A835PDJ2_VANPL|nr:hypothetical protein HPP92_027822 [Vanilla planifolia]